MKKTYKAPFSTVIICDIDTDMLSGSGDINIGNSTSNMGGHVTADSKYRDFDDYEEDDEEAYEEDLW